MRTSPIVGRKAWFGPRRLGWGLAPISIEGWLATLGAIGAGVWVTRKESSSSIPRYVVVCALLAVAVGKGTSPGGPRARLTFESARRKNL